MKKKNQLWGIYLFVLGGLLYNLIEILWRRRTHWSMFLVGGICFRLIGRIYEKLEKFHISVRCIFSAIGITIIEFFSGCYFNRHLKLNVWDYSKMPLNIKGQVCLVYTVLWGFLSIPAGWLHTCCCKKLQKNHFADGHK
jgi:uncharacterized membrane protein